MVGLVAAAGEGVLVREVHGDGQSPHRLQGVWRRGQDKAEEKEEMSMTKLLLPVRRLVLLISCCCRRMTMGRREVRVIVSGNGYYLVP